MLVIARSIRSFVEDHVIHSVVMGPQTRSYLSGVVLESVFEKTLRWTRLLALVRLHAHLLGNAGRGGREGSIGRRSILLARCTFTRAERAITRQLGSGRVPPSCSEPQLIARLPTLPRNTAKPSP